MPWDGLPTTMDRKVTGQDVTGLNVENQPELTPCEQHLAALHATVHIYLSMLQSVAECLGGACPPVGGPYRHRLSRLGKRLAFDSSKHAVEESCAVVAKELTNYASQASAYLRCHGTELRRAVAGLEELVRTVAQRQDFYAARLRQFASQMETTSYPEDPERRAETIALHSAGLISCVESMGHESQSLVQRMRAELVSVEQRLAESEITDPVTGLTNRREMERRIHVAAEGDAAPVLVRFDFGAPVPDEAARQVGARIGSQFRYNDVVCRWSENEFLVLFQGTREIAEARAGQVVPWVAGRYLLDTGEIMELHVEASLVGLEVFETAPAAQA
jgi:GGDEF domain-containing protein